MCIKVPPHCRENIGRAYSYTYMLRTYYLTSGMSTIKLTNYISIINNK